MSIVSRSQQAYGGFHPFDIPGCKLWMDVADASTLTLDASNNVLSWADKSSNARTLTPNSIISKYDSMTKSILLQSNNYFAISPTISAGPTVESMFAVVSTNNVSNSIIGPVNITAAGRNYRVVTMLQQTTRTAGTNNNSLASTATMNTGTKYLLEYFLSGSNVSHYQNGVPTAQGTAHTIFLDVSGSFLGSAAGGQLFNGTLHEVLLYDSLPTDGQRQGIEQYLLRKWRVNAISNFTPTSVAGCTLWLDASDTSTIDLSTSPTTGIWRWRDKSGNSNHATRMTTNAPTYVTGGGVLFNLAAGFSTALQSPATTETGFLVFSATAPTTTQYIISSSNITGVGGRYIISSNRLDLGYRGTGGRYTTGTIIPSANIIYCFSYKIDATANTIKSYFGSQLDSVRSTVPTATTGSNIIGCRDFGAASTTQSFSGTIYEFVLYSNALSDSNMRDVQNYLIRKWNASDISGIPINHSFSNSVPYSIPNYMPLGIPNCVLWLDAADSNAIVLSGSNVSTWYDKSGTLSHVSNATLGQMPTYSNNTLTFSGSQFLSNATAFSLTASNHSIFAVHKPLAIDTSSGNTGLIKYVNGASYIVFPAMSNTVAKGYTSSYANISITSNNSTLVEGSVTSGFNIVSANIFTSNQFIHRNGTRISSNNATPGAGTLSNLSIGSNQTAVSGNYKGDIREVLVYNTTLGDGQRVAVESYLARKWGLTANLPAGHIGKTLTLTRDVEFDIKEVGTCGLWLDATDSTTLTMTGSNVTTWIDKSGNGRNGVLVAGNGATVSTDFITNKSMLNFNSTLYNVTYPKFPTSYTIFTVQYNTNNVSGNAGFQRLLNAANLDSILFVGTNYGNIAAFNGNGTSWNDINSISVNNYLVPKIVSMVVSGATLNLYTDGSLGVTKVGTTVTFNDLWIGYGTIGQDWCGGVGDIIIYNSALSPNQRQQVEGYLAWKWGMQSSLPIHHPYRGIKLY